MSSDSPERPREAAVEQLRAFGLSTYAARTYVALVSLGEGTAKEVSDVADVPRTRVYDAAEELGDWGLVDTRQSTPKRFWPVSSETASRRFHQDSVERVDALTDALSALEPARKPDQQEGVWTVTGRDTVTDRVVEFVDEATDEVVFMTVDSLLTDRVLDRLRAASDRGVTVWIAGLSDSVEAEVEAAVPAAEPFDSMWLSSDTPAGRLLMTDQRRTLVSVRLPDDNVTRPRDETAIWGAGETNSLVVVLRAMFTWQLADLRE